MYKDVWKRFGVKVLIILCSVLLLGGVAIAAPRLRAVQGGRDFSTDDTLTVTDMPYQVDLSKYNSEGDSVSANAIPSQVEFSGKDDVGNQVTDTWRIQRQGETYPQGTKIVDFRINSTGANGANVSQTGQKVSATIVALEETPYIRTDSTKEVEYLITRRPITQVAKEWRLIVGENNVVYVNGKREYSVGNGNVRVELDMNVDGVQKTIVLPSNEYQLIKDGTTSELNKSTDVEVQLNNYSSNGQPLSITGTVIYKKNIAAADFQLAIYLADAGETDIKNMIPLSQFTGEQNVEPNKVIHVFEVANGVTEEITENCDVNFIDINTSSPKVQVRGSRNGYEGTIQQKYNVNSAGFDLEFIDGDQYVSYDEENLNQLGAGKGYVHIPQKMKNRSEGGKELEKDIDYTVDVSEVGFGAQGNFTQGPTAGRVSIMFRGKKGTKYEGAFCEKNYYVTRSLDKATIEVADADFTYDGSLKTPQIKVYFADGIGSDGQPYQLTAKVGNNTGDFTLEYTHTDMNDRPITDPAKIRVDAGYVSIKAVGTGTSSGYIGTKEGESDYTIKQKDISSDTGYWLRLRQSETSPADVVRYPYTGSAISLSNVRFMNDKGLATINPGAANSDMILGTSYYINYYRKDSTSVMSQPPVNIGFYTIEYKFMGNYTGSLRRDIEIYALPISECSIDVAATCDQDEAGAKNHIYAGKGIEHRPEVVVRHSSLSEPVPSEAYTVKYFANENAGNGAYVIVYNSSDENDHSEPIYFTIEKRSLKNASFAYQTAPPSNFREDTSTAGLYTHPYVGKTQIPALNKINWNGIELVEGEDYEKIQVLYTSGGAVTNGTTYPRIKDQQYKYKIKGINNYKDEEWSPNFRLLPKNIATGVNASIADKAYQDGDEDADSSSIRAHIDSALQVVDADSGDQLVEGTDYSVTIDNQVSKNGTVKLTIIGIEGSCYTGTKTGISFNVGNDIKDALARYNGNDTIRKDGEQWFNKSFTPKNPSGYVDMDFMKETDYGNTWKKVSLVYSRSELPLYHEKHYTIQYGAVKFNSTGTEATGSVIFTGINGYYGTLQVYFEVSQKTITTSYIVELEEGYTDKYENAKNIYTGREICPTVVSVKEPDGVTEVDRSDYTVTWKQNINAGTAYVVITGRNNYGGSADFAFPILPRKLDDLNTIRITNLEASYVYTADTVVGNGTLKGVCPSINVEFNPEGFEYGNDSLVTLTRGTHYNLKYSKNEDVWYSDDDKNNHPDDHPQIEITPASGNFTGSRTVYFEITPIDLSQCTAVLDTQIPFFTGSPIYPKVVEVRYPSGSAIKNKDTSASPTKEDIEYYVPQDRYIANQWLSMGDETGILYVVPTKGGHCIGELPVKFLVIGNLKPEKNSPSDINSKLEYTVTPVDYPVTASSRFVQNVAFLQKSGGAAQLDYPYRRNMEEGVDYTFSCNETKIGKWKGTITAIKGNDKHFYGSNDSVDVVIRGNLANAEYTKIERPIAYTSGGALRLDRLIAPVICGERELVYGEDYIISGDYENAPGHYEVYLEPGPNAIADGYLTGRSSVISFDIKEDLKDENLEIPALQSRYEYAHDDPVLDVNSLVVYMNGVRLIRDKDYEIKLVNGTQVSVEGGAYVEITGTADSLFTGTARKYFTIDPYNLKDNYEAETPKLLLTNKTTVQYTGDEVFPEVSIEVQRTIGGTKTLVLGEDFRLVRASGDTTNCTKDTDDNPTYYVRSANNNYTGAIELSYKIVPRSIKDLPDESFDGLAGPFYYLNGNPVRPTVHIKYNNKDLVGVLYNSEVDQSTAGDFTYEYDADCSSVGEKHIVIRGIGNFTDQKILDYIVEPKNIGDSDVELILESVPIVYNGQKQMPPFRLHYGGEDILVYTGTELLSTHMKNPSVETSGDGSAGRVQLTITAADGDNYIGSVSKYFNIDPASLENHTRFMYQLNLDERVDLSNYKLSLPFGDESGNLVERKPIHAADDNLAEGQIGAYFRDSQNANNGAFLFETKDYDIKRMYVEPDTDDVEIREEYRDDKQNPPFSWAGKVMVTITGKNNYTGSASYWYFIGTDISSEASIRLEPTTVVYNSQKQAPSVIVSGVEEGRYNIAKYKDKVEFKNLIQDKDFVNAGTYYIRIEGEPSKGTYATKPHTLTYTITPRPISNSVVIDGFKKEYPYTGLEIRPVGISVTDYIDRVKYRLTEDLDYTLSYSNNLNAGTAFINVECKNNFSGTARANFLITSSTISSGSSTTPNTPINGGTGEISGSKAISPNDVILTMDTANAMHYTGNPVYPKVSIAGMTENVDYTVTFSNNTEVGTATVTITGIGNNRGTITKTFNIIAPLSNCKIAEIPAQQYTGSAVEPTLTVTCGKNILIPGTDYNVTYANNINIGTATATIRAASNSKYTGSASVTFSIANDVGDFIISGYAPTYTYTGNAITPSVVVETGSGRLTQGTDYTISYSNNINAGKATITVKGVGRYSGTKTATFIIEAKNIQGCTTTEVEDRTYTGDAYTPTITVTDGNKVLTSGVDYTVTYTNNTEPGTASILIQGMSNNYSGTKVVTFKIGAVAVKGLKATKVKYNSLKLKWTKQGYADGYQICDAQSKVVKNVTKNSVTLKKLATGKTYRYKVRSYIRNADGTRSYGAFSSVVSATTKLKTPEVEIVSKKTGQARITWSKVSGANGYEIYYKKSSGETYRKVKTVNNANVRLCRVRGMKSGDKAYFRVRAFKKTGSKKVYSSMNKLKVITVK